MSPWELNWDDLQQLVWLFEGHHLTELVLEENGLRLVLKAGTEIAPSEPDRPHHTGSVVSLPPPPVETVPEAMAVSDQVPIPAPMVGVFYRSSSPDTPPFIEIGEEIEVGQTIGLIEAMKVFSEIPSEVAGRVAAIPAQNGQLVQQGEPLVIVEIEDS